MVYTDTRDRSIKTDFKTAVVGGMNEKTGGLYIPVEFPALGAVIPQDASVELVDRF